MMQYYEAAQTRRSQVASTFIDEKITPNHASTCTFMFHPSTVHASALLFRTHVNRMKIELPILDVWHESALRIDSNNKTNKTTE